MIGDQDTYEYFDGSKYPCQHTYFNTNTDNTDNTEFKIKIYGLC